MGESSTDTGERIRVALLYGGPSSEHEVSIESARNVFEHLLEAGLSVVPVYWAARGGWGIGSIADPGRCPPGERALTFEASRRVHLVPIAQAAGALEHSIDVLFPCLHGAYGEDGSIQGFGRVLGLPVVGSPVLAHAIALDKERMKQLLLRRHPRLRSAPGIVMERSDWPGGRGRLAQALREVPGPWIVKPVDAGSSVGLSVVENEAGLSSAIEVALRVEECRGALIETRIVGPEFTCIVAESLSDGVRTLPIVAIRPTRSALFDYEAKYTAGGAEEICPAPVDEAIAAAVRQAACWAFEAAGARGMARADFLVQDGEPYFLELNTMPGLTRGSLLPLAVVSSGMTLSRFLRDLVELSLAAGSRAYRSAGAGP